MKWGDALNFLSTRKRAYQISLKSPSGQEVLRDLAIFCRANETCVIPNDRDRTLVLEGRREVWLRINQHLNLTPEQLIVLYSGQSLSQEETTNG